MSDINDLLRVDLNAVNEKSKLYSDDGISFFAKNHGVKKIIMKDGAMCYVKGVDIDSGLVSAASSEMYRNIGIATPDVKIFCKKDDRDLVTTIQPDVTSLKDFETVLAADDKDYAKIASTLFSKNKWEIFYDESFKNRLLTFMTPECLEQLQNVFLVDELRTDNDRHAKNYFFYKNKQSKLYEGVIVIDLDNMQIFNYGVATKDDFENFLYMQYGSATPQQSTDFVSQKQRIKDIRELINEGVLNQKNIEVLTRALKFDFSKTVREIAKEKKIDKKQKNLILRTVDRLWEYNRETVGKDLGL